MLLFTLDASGIKQIRKDTENRLRSTFCEVNLSAAPFWTGEGNALGS